jgi:hypothetical protein
LAVSVPAAGVKVARSRLTFTVTDGALTPAAVTLVIKRKSDNAYWNASSGQWQTAFLENPTTQSGTTGTWTYAVAGAARRSFVATVVVVEARAVQGSQQYRSSATPEITIR